MFPTFIPIFLHKFIYFFVPFQHVKFYIRLKLSQTYDTEFQRATLWLFQMIRSIHNALIENAVPNPKHMSYFMDHYADTSPKYPFIVDLILAISIKAFIIPCKGKNPSSSLDTCKAEHKVPFVFGVQVTQANSDHAESISWEFWLQLC